ncbi:MAG: RnfABCDGE type electron transport complex subunit D [Lachnospiraceae bacterium]|nr:RnfABCDGE type electron transport complex subunit D [Lachnospiraceae bacterium]
MKKIPYKTIDQALLPVCAVLLYFYGFKAALTILTSVTACILTKYLWNKFVNRKEYEFDSKTVLTGMIIGISSSPSMPLWIILVAAIVSVVIFDELLSKVDENIISPSGAVMAILFIVLPSSLKKFEVPKLSDVSFGTLFYNGVSIVNGSGEKTIWSILPKVVIYLLAACSLILYFVMKYVLSDNDKRITESSEESNEDKIEEILEDKANGTKEKVEETLETSEDKLEDKLEASAEESIEGIDKKIILNEVIGEEKVNENDSVTNLELSEEITKQSETLSNEKAESQKEKV